MELRARKDHIIKSIEELSDDTVLRQIEAILGKGSDWGFELSEVEKDKIRIAQAQVKADIVISPEEVWKRYHKT